VLRRCRQLRWRAFFADDKVQEWLGHANVPPLGSMIGARCARRIVLMEIEKEPVARTVSDRDQKPVK
jgi:hypothetical protein